MSCLLYAHRILALNSTQTIDPSKNNLSYSTVYFLLLWMKTFNRVSISTYANHPSVHSPLAPAPRAFSAFLLFQFLTAGMGFISDVQLWWKLKVFKVRNPHDKQILSIFITTHTVIQHIIILNLSVLLKSFLSLWDGEKKKIDIRQKAISPCALSKVFCFHETVFLCSI